MPRHTHTYTLPHMLKRSNAYCHTTHTQSHDTYTHQLGMSPRPTRCAEIQTHLGTHVLMHTHTHSQTDAHMYTYTYTAYTYIHNYNVCPHILYLCTHSHIQLKCALTHVHTCTPSMPIFICSNQQIRTAKSSPLSPPPTGDGHVQGTLTAA